MKMEMREALKEALEFEKRGYDIYNEVAQTTFNPLVKRTFEYLAKQEIHHISEIKRYMEMEDISVDIDLHGDRLAAVKDFFNMSVGEYREGIEFTPTDREAYEKAMALEQSSYDFYKARREEAEHKSLKSFFAFVMEQERGHYLMLEKTLNYIDDPMNFHVETEDWNFEG